MKHTYNQFRQSVRESRLCSMSPARQLSEAYESLQSTDRMQKNPAIKELIALYNNDSRMKSKYRDILLKPVEKTMFFSLLYDGVIDSSKGTKYEDVKKIDINVADALGLTNKSAAEAVAILKESCPEIYEQLKEGDEKVDDNKIIERYKQRVERKKKRWLANKDISTEDKSLLELPLLHYISIKKGLDAELNKHGIMVPGNEVQTSLNANPAKPRISRDEYLILLKLAWNNPTSVKAKIAEDRDVKKLKNYITTERTKDENKRVQQLYTDISAVEVGPEEALSGFNVKIGEMVRGAYINRMIQKPQVVPVAPDAPQKKAVSAATWENNPKDAYAFLSDPETGFEVTIANKEFLTALRYYFVDDEKKGNKPKMDKQDTLSILHLVVQVMLSSEQVVRSSLQQRQDAKKKITGAENLENMGAGVWEYMKEFSDHPIGSSAMWLVALMAVKQIWKFTKSEQSNLVKYGFWGGMSALAVGLYQQHTSGEAWWEGLWGKTTSWFGKESKLEPKEQTLPNYWVQMLQKEQGKDDVLSADKERLCISVLQTENTKDVLEWYRQKRISAPGTRVSLPFNIDYKLKKQFGANAQSKDIEELMYRSLQRILSNRGKVARQEQLLLNVPNQLNSGDEDLGYQYLMERYVERKYYKAILVATLAMMSVKLGGITIDKNDPYAAKLILKHPKVLASKELTVGLQNAFIRYEAENRQVSTADCALWNVLLMESNPEALRRMNAHAGEAAGLLDEFYQNASELNIKDEWYKRTWGVPSHMIKTFREKKDDFDKVSGENIEIGADTKGKTVRVYMPTGIMGYGPGKYDLKEITFQEFITSTPAQIIEKWKDHAFNEKRKELKNDDVTKGIYEFLNPVRADDDGDKINFGNAGYAFYTNWNLPFMDFLKREPKDFDLVLQNKSELKLTAKFVGPSKDRKIEIYGRAIATGYPVTFSINEIKSKSYADVEKMWLEKAVELKKTELDALKHADGNFKIEFDGNNVKYSLNYTGSNATATTPAFVFLNTNSADIYLKYKNWYDNTASDDRGSTKKDPFAI